jgi:hypothetical protein
MKQPFLLTSIILLIVGLILVSFGSALFTAYAASSDSTWQLSVDGLVNQPSNFSLADLEAMPQTTVSAALYCVDFPTTVVTQGNWTGVKLWTLLNETGVLPSAVKVALYAKDSYSTDLTIDAAKSDNIILAYAKDDAPLSDALRLVVPGHWGYKWISQVVKIELVNYNFKGKWESVGYSDDATITQSNLPPTLTYPSQYRPTAPFASPSASSPSASPRESPPTFPSTPPITNSTSQLPSTQSKNLTSQNFNLLEATAVISIVIVAIAVITISKRKNSHYRKHNPDFYSNNFNQIE